MSGSHEKQPTPPANTLTSGEREVSCETEFFRTLGARGTVDLVAVSSEQRLATQNTKPDSFDPMAFEATLHVRPVGASQSALPAVPLREGLWEGRIEPKEELGRGGMGVVLRARDCDLRRDLALKVMAHPPTEHQTELVRFIEEAQITAQLEHPNVVPVHELGVDPDGRPFFSMKRVRGHSLESILQRRSAGDQDTLSEWGLRRLLDVFLQVCQAIDYAHTRGVIHRDLKPANIMVGDFGEVLVMDWGVAKVVGRKETRGTKEPAIHTVRSDEEAHDTMSGTIIGTPSYMSPEQAVGDTAKIDARTDVYALGAILYEILCGKPPFSGPSVQSVLTRVLTEAPVRPSLIAGREVPVHLEELALGMLEKKHDKRTITLPQVRAHVQDWIEGIGTSWHLEGGPRQALAFAVAMLLSVGIVTYLTDRPVLGMLYPHLLWNALGWFYVVLLVGYPTWVALDAFRVSRKPHDRFQPPTDTQILVSSYYAHRRLATAVAPLFALVLLLEAAIRLVPSFLSDSALAPALAKLTVEQLKLSAHAGLLIPFGFLLTYLLFQAGEARFARKIDRFEPMLQRSRWELIWPIVLVGSLVLFVLAMDFAHYRQQHPTFVPFSYARERILSPAFQGMRVLRNLVLPLSFWGLLYLGSVALVFPLPEILAALKLRYQSVDAAYFRARRTYFVRSVAILHVLRANALYAGAMISCLTAMTMVASPELFPVAARMMLVAGPLLLGLLVARAARRYLRVVMNESIGVVLALEEDLLRTREEERRAKRTLLVGRNMRRAVGQFVVVAMLIGLFALWSARGARLPIEGARGASLGREIVTYLPWGIVLAGIFARDSLARVIAKWESRRLLARRNGDA